MCDAAERGIRLLEEYKDILTNNCNERNIVTQCVENNRKKMPDFKKVSFAFSSSTSLLLFVDTLNLSVSFFDTFIIRWYMLQTFVSKMSFSQIQQYSRNGKFANFANIKNFQISKYRN